MLIHTSQLSQLGIFPDRSIAHLGGWISLSYLVFFHFLLLKKKNFSVLYHYKFYDSVLLQSASRTWPNKVFFYNWTRDQKVVSEIQTGLVCTMSFKFFMMDSNFSWCFCPSLLVMIPHTWLSDVFASRIPTRCYVLLNTPLIADANAIYSTNVTGLNYINKLAYKNILTNS